MAAATGCGSSGPGPGPAGASGARKSGPSPEAEAELWAARVRDLVSASAANRSCCECGQRGVTYVDVTVGSLVCTGCSGALRGLNPPHRVKSISMATFSEAEVLLLQARGNEVCQRVWLGSFDPRVSPLPDGRDPQQLKEFLQDKYERKRWFVAPEAAKPPLKAPTETPAPPQTLLGDLQPLPTAQRLPQPQRKPSTDLLADIGGDPFASPTPAPSFSPFPGPALPRFPFPSFEAFGVPPGPPPTVRGAAFPFGALPAPSGSSNPFRAPQAPTNPFQSNGPAGVAVSIPSLPGRFPSPFQDDGRISSYRASTNPFVTASPHVGIRNPSTNPFL